MFAEVITIGDELLIGQVVRYKFCLDGAGIK